MEYTFAELLQGFRKRAGLKQADLAEALGCGRNTISNWETGTTFPEEREVILNMKEALQLTEQETDNLLLAAGYNAEYNSSRPEVRGPKEEQKETDKPLSFDPAPQSDPHSVTPSRWEQSSVTRKLLITISLVGIVAIGGMIVFLIFRPKASTGIVDGRDSNLNVKCQSFTHSDGKQEIVHRVCAWINIDYDKHRIRGRATVELVNGSQDNYYDAATINVRLIQNDAPISGEPGTSKKSATALERYTTTFNCGGDESLVVNQVTVPITYSDGQQETHKVMSGTVIPRC